MNREELLNSIKTRFKKSIKDYFDKSEKRVYIEIDPKDIKEIVKYIFVDLEARFNIASAIDTRFHIEILYHFTIERLYLLISIKVKLNRDKPKIDSITSIIKGSAWIEREMHELVGIDFIGHPNLKPLLTAESWPADLHPLRRDYADEHKDLKVEKKV